MADQPSGISLFRDVLSVEQETLLLHHIRAVDSWTHQRTGGRVAKRWSAYFGSTYPDFGAAPELPPWLAAVRDRCESVAGISPGDWKQAILTWYEAGCGIAWHSDHPRFGDAIGSLSLASDWRMHFRPCGETRLAFRKELRARSLLLIESDARWRWQHHLPPVKQDRYSITFRSIGGGAADTEKRARFRRRSE